MIVYKKEKCTFKIFMKLQALILTHFLVVLKMFRHTYITGVKKGNLEATFQKKAFEKVIYLSLIIKQTLRN